MPDVFLSYNRADEAHAKALDAWLRAQGVSTFFDQRELGSGQLWLPELEKAIETAAQSVAVLVGPRGLGNTQHYEVQLALTRQARERGFPVIPVILPGTREERYPGGFLALPTWVAFGAAQSIAEDPAALQRLLAAIRRERTDADTIRGTICPYVGLQNFEEDDARLFRGRAAEIEALHGTLRDHRVAAVIGRSGTGKSSLALAGLVPRLRQRVAKGWDEVWDTLVLRPGEQPLTDLATALEPADPGEEDIRYYARMRRLADEVLADAPDDLLSGLLEKRLARSRLRTSRLLIVVDQGEQLFNPPRDRLDQARFHVHADRFLALLLGAARHGPASLVLTIRSDYFDPLQHSPFGPVLKDAQVLLGRVQDLRPCIEAPAELVGLGFAPGLVDRILAEVGDDESNLPLLQHALKRTWLKSGELKQRPVLTNDAYVAAGGVAQAINQDAQDCFQGLPAPQQAAARRLFLRLVRPGEGSAHLRQRAALPEDRVERAVVTAFAKPERRLLFVGDRDGRATVEVAHEALIRGWPTLLDWVEASREKLRTRADVLVWREQNARPGMPPEPIPAGVLLSRARELLDAPGEVPVDDIRDFIGDSAARVDRAASEELRKQKRRARAFGALAALAGAFAMGAGWFWWQADDQRRRAEQNFAVAEGAARTLIDGLSRGRDAEGVPLPVVQGILEAADGGLGQLGAGGEAGILDLRASGLTELGLTRWYRADWPGAQAALEQALAIRRQLAAAAPDDPGRRSDIATVQERLAEVFEAQGAMPTAFAALQAALAAREAASRTRPATADPLRALLRSLALLVDLARRNGDDAEARGFAQRALAVGETLRDLPGHAAAAEDWQQAVVLGRRAGLLPATGTDYPAEIGGVFRDCADCPPMVVIPPGRFRIGSTDGDPDEREGPEVTVNTLAVGRHEITFAEYDACVAAGGCTYRPGDWGWGRGQRPVILVTWHDANAYARWLSARTGQEYRLLTESEWEYAARGRTDRVSTRWFWGDDPAAQCRYANGADQTARDTEPEMAQWRHIPAIFAACADGHGHTSPVGTFDANGFGLFDMAGNVWEWVQDCYVDNYRDLPADGSARREPATCASRVLRGGSWNDNPRDLRSANRNGGQPVNRINLVGFRVARTPG